MQQPTGRQKVSQSPLSAAGFTTLDEAADACLGAGAALPVKAGRFKAGRDCGLGAGLAVGVAYFKLF